jgi:hypothetical protein
MQPIATDKSYKGMSRVIKAIIPQTGGSHVVRIISDGLQDRRSVDVTTVAGAFRVRKTDSGRFDIYAF